MLKDCPRSISRHARGVNLDEMGPFKIEGEFVLLELSDPKGRKETPLNFACVLRYEIEMPSFPLYPFPTTASELGCPLLQVY